MNTKKPALTLAAGKELTPEKVAGLFEKLTGKKPTPEEQRRIRERLKEQPQK